MEAGVVELNRNPENYFAEVEQAAFNPSSLVPGIGSSPDKMLQARLMSYADTHLYRLGVNYRELPVNKPRCPVRNYRATGARLAEHYAAAPNYWPNARGSTEPNPNYKDPPEVGEVIVDRYDSTVDHDDYTCRKPVSHVRRSSSRASRLGRIAGVLGQRGRRSRPDKSCTSSKPTRTTDRGGQEARNRRRSALEAVRA